MIPPIVQEIIALIGERAAFRLIKRRGGRAMYVPRDGHALPDLTGCIEQRHWLMLCKRFGGGYLYLPKCHRAMLQRRNAWIRQARQDGKTIAELARMSGLTDRQLITICGNIAPREALHMPLFDEDD